MQGASLTVVTVPSFVFHFVSPLKANYVHKIHAKCYLQLTDTIFDLTHKRVKLSQTQQQRPESPMVIFAWHASKYKVHKFYQRYILSFFWGTDWHLKNKLNVCWPFTHFIHLLEVCSAKGSANCRTDWKKQWYDLTYCKHLEALCPLFERYLEIIGAYLWRPVLKVRVQLVPGHGSQGFGLEPNKDLIRTCKDQYLIL